MPLSPPYIISWNITRRCALKCPHCYIDSTAMRGGAEASTEEALAIVEKIAKFSPRSMLILTGGEPLLRPDIFTVIREAVQKGLTVFIGTSGAELDEVRVSKLKEAGVLGVGVSLDSVKGEYHDSFRGLAGAWASTIKGMEYLKKAGLEFQIHFSVTEENKSELDEMIDLSLKRGAKALNVFFTVCTGRAAREANEGTTLSAASYETMLGEIARRAGALEDRIKLRARCAPQFMRLLEDVEPESPLLKGGTCGCIAGRSYMRISPLGEITPCPYIPALEGSPRIGADDKTLQKIWERDRAFVELRSEVLSGRCGLCSYKDICGGCRAKALAVGKDISAADPTCKYEPSEKTTASKRDSEAQAPQLAIIWTDEAKARLKKVPRFLRPMVTKGIERYAIHKGISEITPEIMATPKEKAGI